MAGAVKYLDICAGISAPTVAWQPLGWQCVGYSEIEAFPRAVLEHHYPGTPQLGDMTRFQEWNIEHPDVLVGGTPCQSFSVAGLRKGLDDPRGNLMLTYLAIARRHRTQWVVWENVPGVLSSGGGNDFASLLRGLAELGYGFAYRILDAQYFGLAQRRRRVFVVGYLGNWRRAAAVLFERASLSGYPAPSRETRQRPPGAIGARSCRSVGVQDTNRGHLISMPHADISPALKARDSKGVSSDGDGDGAILVPMAFHNRQDPDVSGALTHPPAVVTTLSVRRLTPRECERLQGFPDDYTLIPHRGKPAADGPRYKALGNSMAAPVVRWIGERIAAVDGVP